MSTSTIASQRASGYQSALMRSNATRAPTCAASAARPCHRELLVVDVDTGDVPLGRLRREVQAEEPVAAAGVEDLPSARHLVGDLAERARAPPERGVDSGTERLGCVRAASRRGRGVAHVRYQFRANPNAPTTRSVPATASTGARARGRSASSTPRQREQRERAEHVAAHPLEVLGGERGEADREQRVRAVRGAEPSRDERNRHERDGGDDRLHEDPDAIAGVDAMEQLPAEPDLEPRVRALGLIPRLLDGRVRERVVEARPEPHRPRDQPRRRQQHAEVARSQHAEVQPGRDPELGRDAARLVGRRAGSPPRRSIARSSRPTATATPIGRVAAAPAPASPASSG